MHTHTQAYIYIYIYIYILIAINIISYFSRSLIYEDWNKDVTIEISKINDGTVLGYKTR